MVPDLDNLHHPRGEMYSQMGAEALGSEWRTVPEATPENVKFVRDLESNHGKWEKFGEKGDKWRVRDATEREKYEFLKPLVNEQHFYNTRLPKWEYEERKREIETDGLGEVHLYPAYNSTFLFIRAHFTEGFKHLTREEVQREKEQDDASYHITLCYMGAYQGELRRQVDEFINKWFGGWNQWFTYYFYHIRVTSGSTYEITGTSPFEEDLRRIVFLGTEAAPHISLD